jgi:MFS family permease
MSFPNIERSHDPYSSLRSRDFRLFLIGSMASTVGNEMQAVAVMWDLAQRTGKPLAVGLVGLAQALPVILLAIPAGQVADRVSRKWIVAAAQGVMAVCSAALAYVSYYQLSLGLVYAILTVVGVANAFYFPARHALVTELVAVDDLHNAVTWRSSAWQIAALIGPALGGFGLYVLKYPAFVYLADCVMGAVVITMIGRVHGRPRPVKNSDKVSWQSLSAGFRFVANSRLILASITLDMFAVLLGGAVAMLPFYAKDILNVGALGFGCLRAAPAIGAVMMAMILAHRPPLKRSGRALLLAVIAFGLATIVFAISRNAWLSFLMLVLTGAFDNISVVVRSTLIQVRTPDSMRGRVSAVNSVFINMSNELGAFESGVAARFLGLVPSVVFGGIGSIVVVALCVWKWPELARLGPLNKLGEDGPESLAKSEEWITRSG